MYDCVYSSEGMYGLWCRTLKQYMNPKDCMYCKYRIEPDPPTEKQIKFVNYIADKLDLDLPEFNKKSYSKFIDDWKDHL